MHGFFLSCLAMLMLVAPRLAGAETITVGILADPRPPYNFVVDGVERGVYADILAEIAARTDLAFRFAKLPQKRHLRAFRQGESQLEVGVTPDWRTDPRDVAVSRYSKPMGRVNEILLFRPGEGFAFAERGDAAGKVMCTVLGYFYPEQDLFTRFDVTTEADVIRCVRRSGGIVDAGILDGLSARYYTRSLGLEVDFGPAWQVTDVYFRVHRDWARIIPIMDEAMEALRAVGTLTAIYERYGGKRSGIQ